MLGVSHDIGFPVETRVFPGTKGIQLWGMPYNYTNPQTNETVQIVFMDTEGLGAVGSLSESYDPKLCVLTIVLSSLFIYNVKHEIGIKDISTLQFVLARKKNAHCINTRLF